MRDAREQKCERVKGCSLALLSSVAEIEIIMLIIYHLANSGM
jgi:hypothetical protein